MDVNLHKMRALGVVAFSLALIVGCGSGSSSNPGSGGSSNAGSASNSTAGSGSNSGELPDVGAANAQIGSSTMPEKIVGLWSRVELGETEYLHISADGVRDFYAQTFNGDNCLKKSENLLRHIEGDTYTDSPLYSTERTITVVGDVLTDGFVHRNGELYATDYDRVVGLTVADIQVCST